ncbi:trypsin-like peptidase domain-containing protein [Leptolyngbya sp. CCNP1308]|uniref:trypsin-like peptidase domain-containing protein n=1 Tax=Leptolyngbya sp. CCNP1308 TaxID=3110255 RepID=UPI002B1EE3B4|nr:trypsin-like peptidase domain-containing protein [Leptolyngbya sp. CCNP1308]MEA5449325.1 trypsin-like peptidase domain-containing protein [Leptolyngbya sp. CCNP1308]
MAKKYEGSLKEPELTESVALVESSKNDISDFGSSFLIFRDKRFTYWLTCTHVINEIGDLSNLRVGKRPAQLIAPSEDELKLSLKDTFDLALLRVDGLHWKKPVRLARPSKKTLIFSTLGYFQQVKPANRLFLREISGCLHVDTLNVVASNKYAWVLDLDIDDNYSLQPGYSGSPIFIPSTQQVIGVVDQRQSSGKKGQAIAIDAAISLFNKVPELRTMLRIQTEQNSLENKTTMENKTIRWVMGTIERPLRWLIGSQVCAILDWFFQEGISTISKKASDYTLNNLETLSAELQQLSDEDRVRLVSDFQWEIEKYIERIYGCFLTNSQDLLESNNIRPSLSADAYEVAFSYIKHSLPADTPQIVIQNFDRYVQVLINNLYIDNLYIDN